MITDLFRSPAERRAAEAFADLLDGRPAAAAGPELESLVSLTGSLRAAGLAPSKDFSVALRTRLVQEAAQRSPSTPAPHQRTVEVAPSRWHRIRQVAAALTVVAIVGGAGISAASTRALPGDALYGLKRGLESVQLSLAGSEMARGRELLEQADARLGEAERLASSGDATEADTRARIGQALDDMDAAVRAGSELLTDVYRKTGDVAALELLDRFVVDQQRRLAVLLDRLAGIDAALRDQAEAIADLLVSLHAEVTALTQPGVAVNSESSGAERDPGAVSGGGDGLVQGEDLVGGTGSSPSAGTGSTADGLLGDITGEVQEDANDVLEPLVGTSTATAVPTLPDPIISVSTLPVEPPDELPCVPIAPLTTC